MAFIDDTINKVERAEYHAYGPAPLAGRSKVHPAVGCTHTSAWHKEAVTCSICGAQRFDDSEVNAALKLLEILP